MLIAAYQRKIFHEGRFENIYESKKLYTGTLKNDLVTTSTTLMGIIAELGSLWDENHNKSFFVRSVKK